LVRRHKLDILDIPIAFICERYLEMMRVMEELQIDVAAEFLAMAAELVHIKSKLLLPKAPSDDEDDGEEEDPRAELIRRLLEYQKYKAAAEQLAGQPWHGRDTFGRPAERIEVPRDDAPLREVGVFSLLEAFAEVLKRQKPEVRHHVLQESVSIADRIRMLIGILLEKESTRFDELIASLADRMDLVVTFLAMLEMTRLKLLRVYQSPERTIFIQPRFERPEEALERLNHIDESQYAG
ncbi:MAG: segregation/condensation protein A, partial [Myxococcota bacterium]